MDAYKAAGNSVDIYGSDCSCGCVHFHKLDGEAGMDWGVCTEPKSPRAGLLTFEHMGCKEYEDENQGAGSADAV